MSKYEIEVGMSVARCLVQRGACVGGLGGAPEPRALEEMGLQKSEPCVPGLEWTDVEWIWGM